MKKKLISLGMVLVLLLQLLPTSAFAAQTPKTPYYVALGDSVTYGYGLDNKSFLDMMPELAYYLGGDDAYLTALEYANPNGMPRALYNIHGANGGSGDKWEQYREQAYPQLVANALKQAATGNPNAKAKGNEYANLGLLGATIEDFSDYLNGTGGGGMSSWLFDLETSEIRAMVKDEVSKADFITLAVGSNDLNGAISYSGSSDEDIYYPGDDTPIAQQMVSIVMTVVMLGMLEVPMDLIMQLIGGILNSESSEDEVPAVDASVVMGDDEEIDGDEEETGGILSGINMEELIAILKFVDTENLTKLMSAGVGGAYEKYMGDIEAIMATNPDVQLAVLGIVNPYGNSVEYKGTRYTKAQIIATLLAEIVRMAIEAAKNNTGTEDQPLSEPPVMDVQEIVEFTRKNSKVLAELEEAPAQELDFTATLEESQKALERVENGEAFVFDAEDFINKYPSEKLEQTHGLMKSESSGLDLGGLIGGIDMSGEDDLVNALLYGLIYNMFGVPLQQAMAEMDMQAEDAVNDWNKANNSNNVSFIYAMDHVSKVDPENGVLPKHLFSVHPRSYGHQLIAGVINEQFISDVTYDSNLDGYTVDYNGNEANQTQALWGSKLVLTIPETVGTGSTVDFVVVNNQRVWDKDMSTRTVEVEITDPNIGTFVYAHCSGPDVLKPLTKRNASKLLVMGDSVAAGFSMLGFAITKLDPTYCAPVSFPAFAAQELDCDVYNFGKPGCGSAELLAILSGDKDMPRTNRGMNISEKSLVYQDRLLLKDVTWTDVYDNAIANSNVVTVQVGGNDFLVELLGYLFNSIGVETKGHMEMIDLMAGAIKTMAGEANEIGLDEIKAVMSTLLGGNLLGVNLEELNLALNPEVLRWVVYESCLQNFKYNEARIAAEIDKKVGSNASVICMNTFNPTEGEMVIPATKIDLGLMKINLKECPIGQIINDNMTIANQYLEDLSEAYGWGFVDISDTGSAEEGHIEIAGNDMHPSAAGHRVIADRLVNEINKMRDPASVTSAPVTSAPVESAPAESTPTESTPTSGNGGGGSIGGGSVGGGSVGGAGGSTTVSTDTAVTVEPADEVCDDFTDIALNAWSHESIHYCLENGLMNGVGDNAFNPTGTTTRGMIVTMLARLSGADTTATGSSQWYLPGQEWAVANGISDGTMMTSNITREQLAAMLYRYAVEIAKVDTAKLTADTNTLSYEDVFTISDWANAGVHFCLATGVIGGYEDGTIRPQANATRAEVSAMFMRFCENVLAK